MKRDMGCQGDKFTIQSTFIGLFYFKTFYCNTGGVDGRGNNLIEIN